MRKTPYVLLATLILGSCATAPKPAPQAAPKPAPQAAPAPAPKVVTYQEALPTVVKSFYPNGDPSGTVTTRYTDKGYLLAQDSVNANGVLVETRRGKAVGNLWRITVTNAQSGDVSSFEDRTYSADGELLIQTFLNPKEVPQASNEYSYDPYGRKVVWLARSGSGGLQARTTYTYDAQGNNVRTEVYDAGGVLTNVFESTYDGSKLVSRRGYDAAKTLVEQTNFLWKDGKKVKDETLKPLLRTIEYTYGAGAEPESSVTSVRGRVVERQTFEYQYFTKTKTVP